MSNKNNNTVTWFQVNNIVPMIFTLITTTVTVVGFYFALSNKIDLLTLRVDTLIENQKVIISKYEGVQQRIGHVELAHRTIITLIEQHMGIKVDQ